MLNTIGTSTLGSSFRAKYFSANLQRVLRKALVAEAICAVDNSDLNYIFNPYGNQPTATVQAKVGTYSVTAYTVTDDTLTVTDEVVFAEQVFDFERITSNYDLLQNRFDEIAYSVKVQIDSFVLNNLGTNATTAYTTPVGGFTTATNINTICGDLLGKVAGYDDQYKGTFLVIENTDLTGFIQAQVANGFNYADMALRNGFTGNYLGIDIYVVRTGTFTSAAIGSTSPTMAGARVFGVKNVSTYASPRGVQYFEKEVSGKTGKEVGCVGLIGFKLWTQKAPLIVKITLA